MGNLALCLMEMNGLVGRGSRLCPNMTDDSVGCVCRFVPPGVISVFAGECWGVSPGLHTVDDGECRT